MAQNPSPSQQFCSESYCTTKDFQNLSRGYRRHCGPTAVTNLLLTLAKRSGCIAEDAVQTFLGTATNGVRKLLYWNIDLFHRFGGTSDLFAGLYIRLCLRAAGYRNVRVGRRTRLTEAAVRSAVSRNSILYLELHGHPVYGWHHVLCYGMYTAPGNGIPVIYLRIADGWNRKCVGIPLQEIPSAHFYEITIPGVFLYTRRHQKATQKKQARLSGTREETDI